MLPTLRAALTKFAALPLLTAPVRNAPLLVPSSVAVTPVCTFKVMGKVRRRCKDCFLVMREGRLYNLCKKHPRHKQMLMQPPVEKTWILTHATQGKFRPW